jgi:hypothetical protein
VCSVRRPWLALLLTLPLALAGCGGGDDDDSSGGGSSGDGDRQPAPVLGPRGDDEPEGPQLGFPVFATKNTTRVAGADPVADAAGVAQAAYPSRSPDTRPRLVVLVDRDDWRGAISAAQLTSRPLRAPMLFSDDGELPEATDAALSQLAPAGATEAGRAQVIRIGGAAEVEDYRSRTVQGANPAAIGAGVDRLQTAAAKSASDSVVVASADNPDYAMPAAGWAAKSGDPVLWTSRDQLPKETRDAIRAHKRPDIYVLGPPAAVSDEVLQELRKLGRTKRIAGPDPVENAIAFARYAEGDFGWNVVDPGHGLVFAATSRPADAGAAAPLSATGTYGPLLLVEDARTLPPQVQEYLLDIQPGYEEDPVRGVYNHGWLMGDESAISAEVQARIDTLLEIQPVDTASSD